MLCPGCFQAKSETAPVCPNCEFNESEQRSPLVLPYRTVLNKQYIVGRVLGRPGGFGITYLGWDTLLETLVAIKEYLPRDLAGRQYDHVSVAPHSKKDEELFTYGLGQFIQEARTAAKINHLNVVRVRNFFKDNGTAYLVMDYYKGITLSEYLNAVGGKIPEQLAVDILLRVLDGLTEIHNKGFLHRDIKPHNIYLTTEGKPILLDMGAARTAVDNESLSVLFSSGFTPFEQYYRHGDQGTWTDIYACGATLYYILTGVLPPNALERLTKDELVHPCQLEPTVSVAVADAVLQALTMDPAKRPQTAREFQTLLVTASGVSVIDEQNQTNTLDGKHQQNSAPQAPGSGNIGGTAYRAQIAKSPQGPKPGMLVLEHPAILEQNEPKPKTSRADSIGNNLATVLGTTADNRPETTMMDRAGAISTKSSGSPRVAKDTETIKHALTSAWTSWLWLFGLVVVIGSVILLGLGNWGNNANKPSAPPVTLEQEPSTSTPEQAVQTQEPVKTITNTSQTQEPVKPTTNASQTQEPVKPTTDSEVIAMVNQFYGLVENKQYREAYKYLSSDWRSSDSLDKFLKGYENTISSKLARVEYVDGSATSGTAKVWVRLFARDQDQDRIINQTLEGELLLIKEAGLWRIDQSNLKTVNKTFE